MGDFIKIGLIRPYEMEYNNQDIVDLGNAARSLGHGLVDIYVDKLGIYVHKGGIGISQISSTSKAPEDIDIDGGLLRHLGMIKDYEQFSARIWSVRAMEQNGTYVMNNVMAWLGASDKLASLAILAKSNIPVPETFLSEDMYRAYRAAQSMGEMVAKPLRGAMGFGVMKLDDADMAMNAFSYFSNLNKPIYIQKFLEKKDAGDYRIIVVGGQVIGAEFRKGSTWKSSVAQGAKVSKADVTDEMEEIAINATAALKLDYAGIDLAQTDDGYFILEANPTMSWQGFRKATGIDVAQVLVKHLVSKIKG